MEFMLRVNIHLLAFDTMIVWHTNITFLCLNTVPFYYLVCLQVITGYLLAGSLIGPGGFDFISEMVQVSCFYYYMSITCTLTY